MEGIISACASDDASARVDAMAGLRHLAGRGDETALKLALVAITDEDDSVRNAALQTVRALCPYGGDERAAEAVVQCLRDKGTQLAALAALRDVGCRQDIIPLVVECLDSDLSAVRRAALAALTQLAPKGDEELVAKVAPLTKDVDPLVRAHALNAVRLLAERGSAVAIKAAAKRLCDEDSVVKRVAISTLQELAEKGNRRALDAVAGWLDDSDPEVRAQGVDALALFAEKGDERVIADVAKCVSDSEKSVAARAACALGKLADPGNATAIQAMLTALKSRFPRVRESAVAGLSLIVLPGDHLVISELARMLCDPSECVRVEASVSLQTIAGGDGHAASVLVDMLQSPSGPPPSPTSRQAVVTALAAIAVKNDPSARAALVSVLTQDDDEDVWWSTFQALTSFSDLSSSTSLSAVATRLRHESPAMRRLAVSALKELADKGNDDVGKTLISVVLEHVADAETFVRFEVFETIKVLARAAGDTPGCIEVLANGLRDEDDEVRAAARKALKAIALKDPLRCKPLVTRHVLQIARESDDSTSSSGNNNNNNSSNSTAHTATASDSSSSTSSTPSSSSCVKKVHPKACAAALRMLASIADVPPHDDSNQVCEVVRMGMASKYECVRERALRAVPCCVGPPVSVGGAATGAQQQQQQQYQEGMIAAVIACLRRTDEVATVKKAAILALQGLVVKTVDIVDSVAACMEDENETLRTAAVAAMTQFAGDGDDVGVAEAAQQAIVTRLEHPRVEVRSASVQILRTLACKRAEDDSPSAQNPYEQEEAIHRIMSDHLGEAAKKLPKNIAREHVLDLLSTRISDTDPRVRCEALSALCVVAGGEERGIDMARTALDDTDANVRLCAVGAVGNMGLRCEEGTEVFFKCLDGVRRKLGDTDGQVRRCAWSWLLELCGRHAEMESMMQEWENISWLEQKRESWPARRDNRSAVFDQPSSPHEDDD